MYKHSEIHSCCNLLTFYKHLYIYIEFCYSPSLSTIVTIAVPLLILMLADGRILRANVSFLSNILSSTNGTLNVIIVSPGVNVTMYGPGE